MYDFIIIGSGIIGSFIARELSRYQVKILLLEKENDVANGQTMANSGIIHSGHDPIPNSLKATLCVEGNRLYQEYKEELDLPLLHTGAWVVAHTSEEEKKLEQLRLRALTNGVLDAHILLKETILMQEPNLSKEITQALSLPSTMVTFPWEVAFHALENAIMNGLEIQLNAEVTGIKRREENYQVEVNHQSVISTRAVINAAGIYSDTIAKMVEAKPEFAIRPRRGEYYVLDKRVKDWVKRVIYPLPTVLGKGVLIVPQVHGNILLGPTSIPQQDKQGVATTTGGLMLIKASLQGLSDSIPYHAIIRQFAGVRASSTQDDFYIQESKTSPHFYHVAGIDSPGLTAAPAIAKHLIEKVIQLQVPKKIDFIASISKRSRYVEASEEEKKRLFQQNPQYGNIICKCEHVTEAEVVAAIHGPLGSNTIKGIKKRTRAGSGLCQGGYCEREVAKIIARETKVPLTKIVYHHPQSTILVAETKVKK